MQKYFLVASYYNLHTRKYEEETIVNIPQVDLTTLQSIDHYTSRKTHTELLNEISSQLKNPRINHIAIKFYKTKNSDPEYYKVIEDNPSFSNCALDLTSQPITYRIFNKVISSPSIKSTNQLLIKEKEKLKTILETKDANEFKKIYPRENMFSTLVLGYINSDYDEYDEQQRILKSIEQEFSRYKTFRGWIVSQENLKTKSPTIIPRINPRPQVQPPTRNQKIKTIQENEEEYEKNFQDENNTSYQAYQTRKFNTHYLDEDKEEFLDIDEYEKMNNYYEEPQEETPSIRRRRR